MSNDSLEPEAGDAETWEAKPQYLAWASGTFCLYWVHMTLMTEVQGWMEWQQQHS